MAAEKVMAAYEALAGQARDRMAAQDQAGRIRVQVGSATCEDAAGAKAVYQEFAKLIAAAGLANVVLHQTGCTGRCSREPIVSVSVPGQMPVKYESVTPALVQRIFLEHVRGGKPVLEWILDHHGQAVPRFEFLFCAGRRCARNLMQTFETDLAGRLAAAGIGAEQYDIEKARCFGLCPGEKRGEALHLMVRPSNVIYRLTSLADLDRVVTEHIVGGRIVKDLRVSAHPISQRFFDLYGDSAFFNRQSRIALRNSGLVNPEDLHEYLMCDGFRAAAVVLSRNDPEWTIAQMTASKLRGRGGAGYPTGKKWAGARTSPETTRYIICNADEGDPGAFMDRSMLEGDPFSVLEGMIIGASAIGAQRGFFYIRAEYPMAIRRVEHAIAACRRHGLLGADVLGSGWSFDVEIRLGAGAFVCGEETALIHSIEGKRGQPGLRPPYPTEAGLWGKPTVINNVETLANVPVVFLYEPEWFASLGTAASGGTKVFALAGKVCHTGLVEVPMGTTLREIVYDIGGGAPGGKKIKAVQTGGPAGGCIPAEFLDTAVDFDSLAALGSIMGSGGMIVMDEDDCMVDIAKFFLTFSQDESCGKCTPCREGTQRMLEIIERITTGQGVAEDIPRLERLAKLIRKSSLCGLGRAAPNPVLSTLTYFRAEYEAHIHQKRCPSLKCTALVHYEIDPVKCVGCTACARHCPVPCIAGKPKAPHVIDQAHCIRCGRCFSVCRFDAVHRA